MVKEALEELVVGALALICDEAFFFSVVGPGADGVLFAEVFVTIDGSEVPWLLGPPALSSFTKSAILLWIF